MQNNFEAAVLVKLGEPLQIMELKVPALKTGQVLVKILYSGVCRSQLMEARGLRGVDSWLPHLLGHEGSGIVVDIGPGVTKVKSGDEVILGWIKAEGLDSEGAKYEASDGQIINSGRVTTFSNYAVVSESRVVIKPKELPFDAAVLFGCALPTGAGMVLNELKPSNDQIVIVLGLGGIGLSALIALKAIGVRAIIAIDTSNKKINFAKSLGVIDVINPNIQDVVKTVKELTNSEGADLCIESCGQISTIELGFSLIKRGGGRLLFASHPPEGSLIKINPFELINGKNIAGSWGGASRPDSDIPIMYSIFSKNNNLLNKLITKRYSLENINQALHDLEMEKVFRPIIKMNHADWKE